MKHQKKILTTALFTLLLVPSLLFCSDSLHKAAYNGEINKVKKLLESKINPDARDSFGGTALHAAMFQENTEIIVLLLEAGLDVNAQGTSNGYTPLHDGVWANNLEAVKVLLRYGANKNIKARDGMRAYDKAVAEDKEAIAEYLLTH